MATDYNKILLDKGYTQSQIDAMRGVASSGGSKQDIVKAGQTTSQPTQQTTSQTASQATAKPTSGMNSMGQLSASANSRDFQVGTGDVVDLPTRTAQLNQKVNQTQQSTADRVAKSWDSLSAAQQRSALTGNKQLTDYINSRGLTVKKEETPAATTTTTQPKRQTVQTPKQAEWDYQDNSQARMNQIADNLNNYRQTMPQLFDDESAFYNFFIDGKGRSQDQIDFLWDYFNRVKKFGKYDNMSPDALGTGIANGTVPEDYLNNLKSTDPAKYQEVMAAKQNREDTIKNESFLNDAANMAGIEGWESEPSSIQYGKWNGIWMDEDNNGVDDRREHYATEEEQGYQRQIADLNAANLDIDNTVKHDYEDLVEKYPGATKATLMAMANDRNANLLREKENNLVELTRLQGYVSYMQSERQEMNQAGADSIRQLQDNLGMYYDYSPQGIAELAQAKYGATNITLDQADSGNETQKQMALQNVLDGYYDKYGDIIQRSEQQVINDVIAYAKKNGVGLAQAFQENFVQPLQQKPGFAALSSVSAARPDVFKIGEDTYGYWDDNGNLVSIGGGGYGPSGAYQFTEAEVRTGDTIGNDINSIGHILDSDDGLRIGTYTSPKGYTYNVYANREDGVAATENLLRRAYYGMSLADAAQKWIGQGKDISNAKAVIQQKGLGLNDKLSDANVRKFIEAMGTWEGTLKGGQSLDDWARGGKDLSSYKQGGDTGTGGYNEGLTEIYKQWRDKPDSASAVKDFWNTYGDTITSAGVSKDDFLKQYDAWYEMETADAYLDILSHLDQLIELTGGEYDWGERGASAFGAGDVGRAYDYIKNNLTVQGLRDAKQQGLKLGVLSDSDVRMIGNAATTLSWMQSQGTWNKELNAFREKLLNKNKYLRDRYQNKSAYSDNTSISFNSGDKKFTIGETITSEPTKKAKSIRDLGR